MSIFRTIKSLFSKKKKVDKPHFTVTIRENDDDENRVEQFYRDMLHDAIEKGDKDEIRYYTKKLDKEYQIAERNYLCENARLHELRVDQTVSKDDFEKACRSHMMGTYAFKSLYQKYNDNPLYSDVFKIYAIFLEREGRYVDAATICARALRWGFPNDRTQGGMKGRLMRLVKKAGGEVNGEIEDALKKYCQ
jgi:hypothetical protein